MKRAGIALDRVVVRVGRARPVELWRVFVLPERRQHVAPVVTVVGREVDSALVVAHPAVVLPTDQVRRIGRVVGDVLLGLAAERAILVHPLVTVALALRTAKGLLGSAKVGKVIGR